MSTEVLSSFFRRLQAMISAGIPLHHALSFLRVEENRALREALEGVVRRVDQGSMLSRAFREQGDVFPPLACDLIQAGETTGRIDRVMTNLADYLERSTRLQKKLVAALTYPVLLLLLTFVIVGVLVVFVFPREAEMAAGLGAEVPALTRGLMVVAHLLGSPITLFLGVAATTAAVFFWPTLLRPVYNRSLRPFVDAHVLDLPVIGGVMAKSAYARMLAAQSSLIGAGLGITQSMAAVGALSQNVDLEKRFKDFIDQVNRGVCLGEAARVVYPPLVCAVFTIGEEQGQLDQLLERTARMYEEEVEASLVTLTALLEPLALMFMGVVVGIVVVATSLPTLQLMQKL